jgi:hypothetical protein
VDNKYFLHNVNGLRRFQGAGQTLFPERTLTGQKTGAGQAGQFRTIDPVDMQGLIHSGRHLACKTGVNAGSTVAALFGSGGMQHDRSRFALANDSQAGVGKFFFSVHLGREAVLPGSIVR